MRRCAHVTVLLILAGCQNDYQRTVADIERAQNERETQKLSAVAHAEKQASEARGTKDCHIKQYTSAYLVKERMRLKSTTGYSIGSEMSDLFIRVYKNGSVGLAVTDDTYPGTNAYFLIDGRRYVADGDHYASIDAHGLSALKNDAVIKFSWTDWPYRSEKNREDVFAGFANAYDTCIAFLRS